MEISIEEKVIDEMLSIIEKSENFSREDVQKLRNTDLTNKAKVKEAIS